ncbi:MAG: F0F1 ATP synthase subunit B [Methanosarcina sp.]|uniref:F0F1 ATP synthase subunit B family protein n=1 Tax=Methanosarcina sp. TaxID=2213 RepID=UPI00261B23BD|nr:F0F1 ATP synthase subunit B [Methanosarcina sp.]MDD3245696.1 F0F1 ATP synthase subunit B [Methanosarcina sp.]MDD4247714.1 F0F1 ATP synthase subunit B [Methanosarcina sp.]
MLIDWFTVIAQVLNFLILVWLLKRFLYKPILNAIDAREKKVADELADADAKEAEAQKEKEEFRRKNEEFDQQHTALLSRAKDEAKAERQRLLEEVRKEASDLRSKQQEALRNDKQNLNQAISRRAQQEVFAIARKALQDLAGTSLEERTVDAFAQRLLELEGAEKEQVTSALGVSSSPVLVRTAFELPQAQRDLVKKTIKEMLGIEIQARFEIVPDLVSGIELTANGQKVAWSIADYLSSLEKSVDELLKEQPKSETKTEPELKSDGPESKTEPEAKTRPESTDESATEQGSETKQESDQEQGSETKQESENKIVNPELKPK